MLNSEVCTGCGVCELICKKNAIHMKKNDLGFLYPEINKELCIDCKACVKNCPLNQTQEIKVIEKKYYAFQSQDKSILDRSSSGGFFCSIAKFFLESGGIVYGASLIDYKTVKHIAVSSVTDLYKILGTKYLQSEANIVFEEISTKIESGFNVLFCGTPCQVNALKFFLRKDFSNLYTIDLFCHGVPSPKIFEQIINERKFNNPAVNFRDKFTGWNNYSLSLTEDTKKAYFPNAIDSFNQGFINDLYLRESCYHCKLNKIENRIGDISIGDFWNIENFSFSREFINDIGVTAVIINTTKGEELLNILFNKNNNIYEVNKNDIISGNINLVHSPQQTKFSNCFLENYKKQKFNSLDSLINKSLGINRKVAVLNHAFSNDNYGALMVAFSMQKILQDIGFEPEIINFSIDKTSNKEFDNFRNNFLKMTKKLSFSSNWKKLNNTYSTFIVGSDQVWRNWWHDDKAIFKFFLDFADYRKNLISYGSSFGINKFEGNPYINAKIKRLLSAFSSISVREDSGIEICKNDFNVYAQSVLDPTLLCPVDYYNEIINSEAHTKHEKKFLTTMIFPNEDFDNVNTKQFVSLLSKKLNYEIVEVFDSNKTKSFSEWLWILKNSELNIIDSFHGLMFSIIFKKQFICLCNCSGGAERFTNILKKLNLLNRLFSRIEDINIEEICSNLIDYDEVYKKLEILKEDSLKFLLESLSKNVIYNSKVEKTNNIFLYPIKLLKKIVKKCLRILKKVLIHA